MSAARLGPLLIATDSFKGTFTAKEASAAIALGVRAAGGQAHELPVADGGEGTAAVLLGRIGGAVETRRVRDPLGRPVEASFAMLADGRAVVEAAAASGLGLGLVTDDARDPVNASTFGTGELIAAALEAGADEVLVAVGGTATTDGGLGAILALAGDPRIAEVPITVLCDVDVPFVDAAATFAPQKGADPAAVELLRLRLETFARWLPRDPRPIPFSGAGGGLSGGLWSCFGASLVSGADRVLGALGFDGELVGMSAVVLGEGSLDAQTTTGKIVARAAARARSAGVPVYAVAGRRRLGDGELRSLGIAAAIEAGTAAELEAAGAEIWAGLSVAGA